MYTNLNVGALVRGVDFAQSLDLAEANGFLGVSPNVSYLQDLSLAQRAALQVRLAGAGLRWGAAGIPVDLGGDDDAVAASLETLRVQAGVMEQAGIDRSVRWIMPASDTLDYQQNLERHADRLSRVAAILAEHGVRLGLEYVGPKTMWSTRKYPFVRTLAQTQELIAISGATNVGICLDTFHWFCAGESAQDLRGLSDAQVVSADLNDGRAGISADEQIDGQRELPGRTGVIDVTAFLQALESIGYTGPVQAEPFNAALREMEPAQAVAETAASLKEVFDKAGVTPA